VNSHCSSREKLKQFHKQGDDQLCIQEHLKVTSAPAVAASRLTPNKFSVIECVKLAYSFAIRELIEKSTTIMEEVEQFLI